jgi:hypothetical protein
VYRQAVDLILETQLFFFELVKKDVVGVGALFFPIDLGLD